jgi:hypothetical protein
MRSRQLCLVLPRPYQIDMDFRQKLGIQMAA